MVIKELTEFRLAPSFNAHSSNFSASRNCYPWDKDDCRPLEDTLCIPDIWCDPWKS